MKNLQITKKEKELQEELKQLKKELAELENSDSFKISTNTAFLLNSKMDEIFNGYGYFPDWLRIKQEQHWEGKNDSYVEITFKLENAKKINRKTKTRAKRVS